MFEEIMVGIAAVNAIAGFIARQAAIAHANGDINDEQLAAVRTAAPISDDAFDAEVAAARAKIGGGDAT